jgi:hypothetical protein
MQKKFNPYLLLGLSSLAALMAAAPIAGDYVTRQPSVWQKDKISNILNTFTGRNCIVSKVKPEKNVGKGPYTAIVNSSACTPGNVAGPHDTWEIITVDVVENPSDSHGYIAKMWTTAEKKDNIITPLSEVIYWKYTAYNGPNNSDKNGKFLFEGCSAAAVSNIDCVGKLSVFASGNSLSGQVEANLGNGFGKSVKIVSSVANDVGWGSLVVHSYVNGQATTSGTSMLDMDMNYAYSGNDLALNVSSYLNGDPSSRAIVMPAGQSCLDRTIGNAKTEVFNYEVYNTDGSIYKIQKPQFPYRIIDSNGVYVRDGSGNFVSGRLMWDDTAHAPGWYLSVQPSVIRALLDQGQTLRAESWLAGVPNYTLAIRSNPNDSTSFQVLDITGAPYQTTADLRLKFHVASSTTVKNLIDNALENTDQNVSYMGNGYLWGIPWDTQNSFHYSILNGVQATGVDDGKTYYIRPMFYSLDLPSKALGSCEPDAIAKLSNAVNLRSQIPVFTTFAADPTSTWVDPRAYMGAAPSVSAIYKYVDGVLQ